jgi:hypothetical protein
LGKKTENSKAALHILESDINSFRPTKKPLHDKGIRLKPFARIEGYGTSAPIARSPHTRW